MALPLASKGDPRGFRGESSDEGDELFLGDRALHHRDDDHEDEGAAALLDSAVWLRVVAASAGRRGGGAAAWADDGGDDDDDDSDLERCLRGGGDPTLAVHDVLLEEGGSSDSSEGECAWRRPRPEVYGWASSAHARTAPRRLRRLP